MTRPLIIAHRGASAYRPEHTLAAYALAIEMGADFIEPDLVLTRDGALICRHEPLLDETTNVAMHQEFADRRKTALVDGDSLTGWFAEDFTLAEIKRLRARERIPGLRAANSRFDDAYEIPTFAEVLELAAAAHRPVGVYPETKHPTYFAHTGLHADGTPIGRDIGMLLIAALVEARFTDPRRLYIQSFEVANLLALKRDIMPAAGLDLPLIQLLGDTRWDAPARSFAQPYDIRWHAERGADLAAIYGDLARLIPLDAMTGFAALVRPEALDWMARGHAAGIGPWKDSLLPRRPLAVPVEGRVSQLTGAVAPWLADARRAGLAVHPYTLRPEPMFLSLDAQGHAQSIEDEARDLVAAGATGLFMDAPDRWPR